MKKKIAILGSTGSIGKTCLRILSKDKRSFTIELLSANKNYKLLLNQAKKFKVKNIIISDQKYYEIAISKKIKSINIYNNFDCFKKIFPKKIDYVMSSIVGLEGLIPTLDIIKYTRTIAIANKESIICAWNLIKKKLSYYKTNFIPVDSEHFSIWYALKNSKSTIKKIYLTASGGSLLNFPKKKLKRIKLSEVLNHPNWKMGNKITVDSSTMMNKVFEVIEAKKIFNLNYNQIDIIIHPKSYIHAIIQFSDGMIKIIAHDTTMVIPIFNSLYHGKDKNIKSTNVDFNKLNGLNFKKVDTKKFPSVNLLKKIPNDDSLFETIIVTVNDEIVEKFLKQKLNYCDINNISKYILNKSEFKKYRKKYPRKVSEVVRLSNYVRNKINSIYI